MEHYVNADDEVKEALRTICNEMILDDRKYSSPLLSMSTSTYLYKGKNKDRKNPSSYRKVSIGSICNKIVDCYMESTIKELIKRNQSKLQFGFTKNVDYRACSILRETAVNYNSMKGKTTMILAVDVSNAFSRAQRESQLYELWRTGCRYGVFLYCLGQYKNTYTVIRNGSEYSPLILELQGSKQGGSSLQETLWYTIPHGQDVLKKLKLVLKWKGTSVELFFVQMIPSVAQQA